MLILPKTFTLSLSLSHIIHFYFRLYLNYVEAISLENRDNKISSTCPTLDLPCCHLAQDFPILKKG